MLLQAFILQSVTLFMSLMQLHVNQME